MDKNRLKNIIAEEVDRVLQQESGLNELSKLNENKFRDVSDKFKNALDRLPDKAFTTKNIEKLIKKMREKRPDAAMAYTKDAFGWLMKESINEDYSQRARNFRVALRRRLEKMKPGQVIRYGKLFWTAQGKNNFRDSLRNKTFPNGRMTPGQDVVQALKFAVQSDIMKHRGAAGDDMVKKYLKFEGKLTEAPKVAPQTRMEFGVEYRDSKGRPKKDNPLVMRFKTKAQADKYAKRGNKVDKVGGKYTVVQVPIEEKFDSKAQQRYMFATNPKAAKKLASKMTKKDYDELPDKVSKENVAPDHDGKAAPFGSGYKKVKELEESTKAYEKALQKMARDNKLKMLSKSDKEKLIKIAQMLKKANESVNEGANANRWFSNLKYYYQKGLSSPDLRDPAEKKAYNKLAKQFFSKLRESFKEGKLK